MASTFPTSLDTFTNPTATSLLTSPSHSLSHSDLNDAVEALEAKVAIGNTVLGTYQAWTPTAIGWTIGNGTWSAFYARVNNLVHVYGTFTFGSTSAISTALIISGLPVGIDSTMISGGGSGSDFVIGECTFQQTATNNFHGFVASNGPAQIKLNVANASSTYVKTTYITGPTIPFTWATGDYFRFSAFYEAA